MMICLFGDRDHFWKRPRFSTAIIFFLLLPSLWFKHGSLFPICDRAALWMELCVRWILCDAENRHVPRETKGGFYTVGG